MRFTESPGHPKILFRKLVHECEHDKNKMCDFRKAKGSKNTVFLGGNAVETNESYTYLKTLATKSMYGLISKLGEIQNFMLLI